MYAITVSQQHEVHRSLTLNILQGTPQGKAGHRTLIFSASHFYAIFLPGIFLCALMQICHLSTSITLQLNKRRKVKIKKNEIFPNPVFSSFGFVTEQLSSISRRKNPNFIKYISGLVMDFQD